MTSVDAPHDERSRPTRPTARSLRLAAFFLVLVVAFVGLGELIVHVLSQTAVGALDRSIERALANHRTSGWNTVTTALTWLAETPTITVLTAVLAITARLLWKRWRDFFFVVVTVAGETAAFVIVTFFVHRPRPPVPHLDAAPPTSSFPSGHTAAAVAFYGVLAVLCSARLRNRVLATVLWALAVVVPILVAGSRMYRGMHHLTDVVAGALLGVLWLVATTMTFRPVETVREQPAEADEPALRVAA